MRVGEGLISLSLKSQLILESWLHAFLKSFNAPDLLIINNNKSFFFGLSKHHWICYLNQRSRLSQYFSPVLSLVFIISSLIHPVKFKNMLIIPTLRKVGAFLQCGNNHVGFGVGWNWIQSSILAVTQPVILAKLHNFSKLWVFLLAKWW